MHGRRAAELQNLICSGVLRLPALSLSLLLSNKSANILVLQLHAHYASHRWTARPCSYASPFGTRSKDREGVATMLSQTQRPYIHSAPSSGRSILGQSLRQARSSGADLGILNRLPKRPLHQH